jgi:hypothetical protein
MVGIKRIVNFFLRRIYQFRLKGGMGNEAIVNRDTRHFILIPIPCASVGALPLRDISLPLQ